MIKKITFKSNTILISLIALSVSICNTCYASAGKLLFVNGDVLIQDLTGKQHKGQKGGELNEGDSVITSPNGFAQIRMDDGGAVSVRPESNFKITKFQFNGKTDGSEKSSFSLINGSIRAVTGVIGNAHRENYKIETATATIGVRGTGADVGHSDNIGTAIHTLFGSHIVTSLVDGSRISLITLAGQTALASFGTPPKLIPSFPFSLANSIPMAEKSGKASDTNQAKDNKSSSNQTEVTQKNTANDVNSDISSSEPNKQTQSSSSSSSVADTKPTETATSSSSAAADSSSLQTIKAVATSSISTPSSTALISSSQTASISTSNLVATGLITLPVVTQINTTNNIALVSASSIQATSIGTQVNNVIYSALSNGNFLDQGSYLTSQNVSYSVNTSIVTSDGGSTFTSSLIDGMSLSPLMANAYKFSPSVTATDEVGSDVTVTWGRWSNYTLSGTSAISNSNAQINGTGSLHAIYASNLTSASQLSALASSNQNNISYGTLVTTSHTSNEVNGLGSITSASANVNFSQGSISISMTGADLSSSQNGLGNYSASGSGQISSFTRSGIGLTGSGFTGSSTNATLISGRIQGGFVGSDAGGLISAFALSGLNGSKTENGILYLKK